MKKILCFFGFHKKIICFDGMTNGLAKVCLRENCRWKRAIIKTEKVEQEYQRQMNKQ
jgi:hypothetical protein